MALRIVAVTAAAAATAAVAARPIVRSRRSRRAEGILSSSQIEVLNGNQRLLSEEQAKLVARLFEAGQEHLFANWPAPGTKDSKKRAFLQQLLQLDRGYTGGLEAYIRNAKKLLVASAEGKNPFDGYTPSVPQGVSLQFGNTAFRKYEVMGCSEAAKAAFVLVAGGIGERLGYSGIKIGIPTEMARGVCFLELYIEHIKALQAFASGAASGAKPVKIPLAIMTSDDTHLSTLTLLRRNNYFGLDSSQVHLMKQEKVACISDNDAHIAVEKDDPFKVETKPHGHGDVHALLYSTGLASAWLKEGKEWVCFFQDTNALVFRGVLPALGVAKENGYDFTALAVPRKAKEAIGGIATLKHTDGSEITINVEYNQLEPLLMATGNSRGDVNDSRTGYSPFPGNINQLVIALPSYVDTLNKSEGIIAEFVNPKYKDETRTTFKKSTRLECMMQDYPKSLPTSAQVGFTQLEVWAAYSPVKNHPKDALEKVKAGNPSHSATSGELDIYAFNCAVMQMLGAKVDNPQDRQFNGLSVKLWPRIIFAPSMASSYTELAHKVRGSGVEIAQNASMVLDGPEVYLSSLVVDGALVIRAVPGAAVTVDGLTVNNNGWEWKALEDDEDVPEYLKIRGFQVVKHETMEFDFKKPGKYTLSDSTLEELDKFRVQA